MWPSLAKLGPKWGDAGRHGPVVARTSMCESATRSVSPASVECRLSGRRSRQTVGAQATSIPSPHPQRWAFLQAVPALRGGRAICAAQLVRLSLELNVGHTEIIPQIGTIERRLAWPLRKDHTHIKIEKCTLVFATLHRNRPGSARLPPRLVGPGPDLIEHCPELAEAGSICSNFAQMWSNLAPNWSSPARRDLVDALNTCP